MNKYVNMLTLDINSILVIRVKLDALVNQNMRPKILKLEYIRLPLK